MIDQQTGNTAVKVGLLSADSTAPGLVTVNLGLAVSLSL